MRQSLLMLWQILRSEKDINLIRLLISGICFIIFSKACIIAVPLIYGNLLDSLNHAPQVHTLIIVSLIIGYGGMKFMSSLFSHLQEYVLAKPLTRMMRHLSTHCFEQFHHQTHEFHLSTNAGSLSEAIHQGMRGITNIFLSLVFGFFPLLLELVLVMLTIFAKFNLGMMLILTTIMFAYFFSALYLTKLRLSNIRTINEGELKINSFIIESYTNFENIKVFNTLKTETQKFDHLWHAQENVCVKSMIQLSSLKLIQRSLLCVILVLFLYFSVYQLSIGSITLGQMVMLFTYVMHLFDPIELLSFEQDRFRNALIDFESIINKLKLKPAIIDPSNIVDVPTEKAEIQFHDVNFGYNPNKLILKHTSFTIPHNQTVALIGKTGAGKTTISRLLQRFYDVSSGYISVNGVDIRHMSLENLRELIGVVPQEITLFNDTIYHNIAYAKHNATYQEVEAAARSAQLSHFIENLPEKYNTKVGERGLKLSGGERQRIALARALLKQPKILILDEATSSLDHQTEKMISETLKGLQHHYTILIITHRLKFIKHADKIIKIENQKVNYTWYQTPQLVSKKVKKLTA